MFPQTSYPLPPAPSPSELNFKCQALNKKLSAVFNSNDLQRLWGKKRNAEGILFFTPQTTPKDSYYFCYWRKKTTYRKRLFSFVWGIYMITKPLTTNQQWTQVISREGKNKDLAPQTAHTWIQKLPLLNIWNSFLHKAQHILEKYNLRGTW